MISNTEHVGFQEEKDLLLKDLSARLPYDVKCRYVEGYGIVTQISKYGVLTIRSQDGFCDRKIESVNPYLFPLSSMTEEQRTELCLLHNSIGIYEDNEIVVYYARTEFTHLQVVFDWLNSHHFDFRGLIDRKLAIDATGLNIY